MEEFKTLLDKLDTVIQQANVDAVFGKPEQIGERVLIPVAEVVYGLGAGMGSASAGESPAPSDDEVCCETPESPEEVAGTECECPKTPAMGGGGGAGGRTRPLAYIEVGPEGVKVQSIVDEQKIALAGIALSFWLFGWLGLVLRAIFRKR
ncbi:MAG: hypothetical protein JXA33_01665 [Anaerolineae bacterium]|nr:hypothetical protein [Anaerolineae bacterium]